MTTALATMNGTALAHAEQFFTPDQERIILNTYLGGASKEEAQVLLATVQRRRLDPFSRQVFFVKRWDSQKREEVWAIQTSIDGLRAIAERTGKYDGQSDPEWEFNKDGHPTKCTVRVYRKDWTVGHHAAGVAFFDEYAQKKRDGSLTQFWLTKPRLMLAKCAEALALRKAFPEDTAGLYVPEEMGQEEDRPAQPARRPTPEAALAATPRPDPVVVTVPDLAQEDETRRAAKVIAAAAEALQGTVMADASKARMFWKRATDPAQGAMTKSMFEKFVAETLGALKPSRDWTAADLDQLAAALDAQNEIKF